MSIQENDMAKKKNYVAFTTRIPPELNQQIEDRAGINRRSKAEEVQLLLERGIDSSVASDIALSSASASGRK